MTNIFRLLSGIVAAILLIFTARRWLFMLTVLVRSKPGPPEPSSEWPSVLILVPARNEAESLPALLTALEKLDYPAQQLSLGLINDGSSDETGSIMETWANLNNQRHYLPLKQNVGKAQALNVALNQLPNSELIAIYDADERPEPDALRKLVQHFSNPQVGAVSGRRVISNSLAGPAASYTTFENLVHQLITMQAKDRLKLAPAILGANCVYRRKALTEVSNFKTGTLLEDSDITLNLTRVGWETRFEPHAVSYHRVPETVIGYWRQHSRWARGFNDVTRAQASPVLLNKALSWPLRLELMLFALGYFDRIALFTAVILRLAKKWSHFPLWVIFISLITPYLQIITALKLSNAPAKLWAKLIWVPPFFIVDITMALNSLLASLKQTPHLWEERKARR